MIKLRCLAVTDDSNFFAGDVVDVVGFSSKDNNKTGSMKIKNKEAIAVGPFRFKHKTLYMDHSWWRVLLVPNTEAA